MWCYRTASRALAATATRRAHRARELPRAAGSVLGDRATRTKLKLSIGDNLKSGRSELDALAAASKTLLAGNMTRIFRTAHDEAALLAGIFACDACSDVFQHIARYAPVFGSDQPFHFVDRDLAARFCGKDSILQYDRVFGWTGAGVRGHFVPPTEWDRAPVLRACRVAVRPASTYPYVHHPCARLVYSVPCDR